MVLDRWSNSVVNGLTSRDPRIWLGVDLEGGGTCNCS